MCVSFDPTGCLQASFDVYTPPPRCLIVQVQATAFFPTTNSFLISCVIGFSQNKNKNKTCQAGEVTHQLRACMLLEEDLGLVHGAQCFVTHNDV